MRSTIRLMDLSGDSKVGSYDPTVADEVKVAQDQLTAFLENCVRQYSYTPPVWSRRFGEQDFETHDGDLTNKAEILVHPPLVGG